MTDKISFNSSVNTLSNVPYLRQNLYAPDTDVGHNYKVTVTENGIHLSGIDYEESDSDFNSDSENDMSLADYSYQSDESKPSGYLDRAYIHNWQATAEIINPHISFEVENVKWSLSVPDKETVTVADEIYKSNKTNNNRTPKTEKYNMLDLVHDPSFAQFGQNIINFKKKNNYTPTVSNVCVIDIKSRYVPTFKNELLKDTIHMFKPRLVSIEPQGLYIMGLKRLHYKYNYYFLTGDTLLITNGQLLQVALETKNTTQKQLIIVTKDFISRLKINNSKFNNYFSFHLNNDAFEQYIKGETDPVFTSPLSSKRFIQNNYEKIAQSYIKANPNATKKFDFDNNKALTVEISILIVYGVFAYYTRAWELLFEIPITIDIFFIIILPLIVILNSTAWGTFLDSQVISPTCAIITSIISVIVLILSIMIII